MLGGFLLGGFLGSLLFGGLGGLSGGIGMMDLLVMGGLAALAISFLRRRAPEPAPASAYGRAELPPATPVGPPRSRGAAVAAGAGRSRRAGRGSRAGRRAHPRDGPGLRPGRFLGIARDLFVRLQIGWSAATSPRCARI